MRKQQANGTWEEEINWMYGDSYTNITKRDAWIIGLLFVEMILGSVLAVIFL